MLITKVTIENYGVFRDRKDFDFNCTTEKPIILFGGKNGSGKTTLFEAILLCLHGSSFFEKKISKKEYDKFLAHKIHRYLGTQVSADAASITVEFKFFHQGKVDQYAVTRSWSEEDGHVNEKFLIKVNEKSLDSVEETEWESFIGELIPRGISKLFFFDGEKITKMAEEENEDVEIKSSFDVLLGLDLVEQLQSDLRIHVLRLMGDKEKEILQRLDEHLKEKQDLHENIRFLQDKLALINEEIDNEEKTISSLETKVSKLGGEYAIKRDELKTRKANLEAQFTVIQNNIRVLCSDVLPFTLIPHRLDLLVEQLKSDENIVKRKFEKEILEESFDEIKSEVSAEKFWSKLELDTSSKEKILTRLKDILNERTRSDNKIKDIGVINFSTVETAHILNLIDKINNQMPPILEKETIEFNKFSDELKKIETALANAPRDDEIGPLISDLNTHHEKIGYLKKEREFLEQKIASDSAMFKMINFKIKGMVDEKYKNKKDHIQAELSQKVQIVLDDYVSKLKLKKLQLLEKYLLESTSILLHKENFIDRLVVDKETFRITLYRKDGMEIRKDLLSKGEKQMFAMAIVWALAKTSGRPLPFIIDTPLGRLDSDHRENLIEKFFPHASHQVAIFSTNSEVDEKYYPKLKPYISRSYVMKYDPDNGKTKVQDGYFWNEKGGKLIAV